MIAKKIEDETQYLTRWKREEAQRKTKDVILADLQFRIDKSVFSPEPERTHSTLHLINHLPNLKGKSVLDIGTGAGVLAVIAAKRGALTVMAVDTDPIAIANAETNVSRHDLENVVSIVSSDLFENIRGQFDIILANLPIWDSAWEAQTESMKSLYGRFFSELKLHLALGGKLFLVYASFGNLEVITRGLKQIGVKYKIIEEDRFGVTWYLFETV